MSDEGAIAEVIDEVLAANPGCRRRVPRRPTSREEEEAAGFLMGQVMRELKGQGNAQVITKLLADRLQSDA